MTRIIDIRDSDVVSWSAQVITTYIADAIRLRGRASLALAGGSTPREVYARIASEPFRSQVAWQNLLVFWGDERCVPPDHAESNFRMAREAFLDHVPIPQGNIFRIKAEIPPEQAAIDYENTIRKELAGHEGFPQLDLVLLGLGEDGHTASLFPDTTGLTEDRLLVASVYVRRLNAHRITMTYPVINRAARVLFIVAGKTKSAIVRNVLEGPSGRFPSQGVKPDGDGLHWILDRDAAALLQHPSPRP
jgi:6-phosphogluconolactonase